MFVLSEATTDPVRSARTSLPRTAFRWGAVAFGLHSPLLLLLAPSAFLYHGEGFILSGPDASHAQRMLDAPVHGLVYEVVNHRLPRSVQTWVFEHTSTIDEASLLFSTIGYFVVGGAFYFLLGAVFGTSIWSARFMRARRRAA